MLEPWIIEQIRRREEEERRRHERPQLELPLPERNWPPTRSDPDDPSQDEDNRDWARGFAAAMQRFGVGTAFANFIEPDEGDRLRHSYGEEKYARLVEAKLRWDPENLFRLNQNIPVNGG